MIVGIDLGTTNSLVTYFNGNHWELIPNEFGKTKTPSVISFDDGGNYYVGDIAKERLITHPNTTFSVFKRQMGSDKTYGKDKLSAQDLSVLLLDYLVKQSEAYLGEKITEAVITVPAYFDDKQRHATKTAGILAGIEVNQIINEPSAAALAYYHKFRRDGYSLIFDFGGGTLDISIVDIFDGVVDVIAVSGDTNLGGIDIDKMIVNHFISRKENGRVNIYNDLSTIYESAEQTKIKLSESNSVELVVHGSQSGSSFSHTYTNELLTDICYPLLERIKTLIDIALIDAGLEAADLNEVICVGGSSKVLFVRQYLEHILKIKVSTNINPDEAIAIGAGIVASMKDGKYSNFEMVLTDVCPFSLGLELIDNRFGIIIPKNSTLPISKSSTYVTTQNRQKFIRIAIFQGDSPMATSNTPISDPFEIEVEPADAGASSILVNFAYDINGILTVEATSSVEKLNKTIITNENLDKDWLKKKQKELERLKEKKNSNTELELLISKAEAIYRKAPYDKKESIREAIERVLEVNELQKPTLLARTLISFNDYLNEITDAYQKDQKFEFKQENPRLKN